MRASGTRTPRETGEDRAEPGKAGKGSVATVDYVSALVPPFVMAVAFTFLVRAIVKSQGGANKAKEDAAVDAAIARAEAAEAARREQTPADHA